MTDESLTSARVVPAADPSTGSAAAGITATQSRKKHVVFLINSLAGGGAERVMCTLLRASEAEQRDCEVGLLLLDRETAAYDVPPWVELQQLDCRHSLIRSIWAVFKALRRTRPDVTISFLTRANVANVIAASLLGIPAIVSERVDTSSHLGRSPGAAIARRLVRATYPRARRIIAVSQGVADSLHARFGVARDRTRVISNPIDVDAIRTQAGQGALVSAAISDIVAMGRLVPNKNFPMLIDAFAKSGVPGNLLIFGEGPDRAALEDQIATLQLRDRVILAGFSANPFPAIVGAGLYVSSSNAEGFPNSLLEAMSVGLPVIATNCPSGPSEVLAEMAREQVGKGVSYARHGILVPPNDSGAMVKALRAMQDPDLRRDYGARAARRAVEFGVERAKNAYWSVIREIV